MDMYQLHMAQSRTSSGRRGGAHVPDGQSALRTGSSSLAGCDGLRQYYRYRRRRLCWLICPYNHTWLTITPANAKRWPGRNRFRRQRYAAKLIACALWEWCARRAACFPCRSVVATAYRRMRQAWHNVCAIASARATWVVRGRAGSTHLRRARRSNQPRWLPAEGANNTTAANISALIICTMA